MYIIKQLRRKPLSALDLVEALQLGHAVSVLHDLKILALLTQPSRVEALARKCRLDPRLLHGVLEYVAARTDLVLKKGTRFAATTNYSKQARFLVDLYAGAYLPNANRLQDLLRRPALAPDTVDRVRHARAFDAIGVSTPDWLAGIVRQLRFNHLLDIGCGSAALLVQLAAQDSEFFGWGVEANPAMCKAARRHIRTTRTGTQLKVMEGDATNLCAVLPAAVRSHVRTVTACHMINEMFGSGSSRAVTWLRQLRKIFPGRPLLLSDYYGSLGSGVRGNDRETLLHDYVQTISGQGVPPASIAEWQVIYVAAGCRLVHIIEDKSTTRFIHIVIL